MWEFLANNVWPIFGIGIALFLGFAWWYRQTQTRWSFVTALLVFIVSVLVLGLSTLVSTPVKEIHSHVQQLVQAGRQRDVNGIMNFIDPNYRFGETTAESIRTTLHRELGNHYHPNHITIQSLLVEAQAEMGISDFLLITSGNYTKDGFSVPVPRYLVRLSFRWKKTPTGWKITEIRRFDPSSSPPKEIPLQAR